MPMLQWGHRFISVETRTVEAAKPRTARASMGPPIYIGGNPGNPDPVGRRRDRFNGATDLYRWKRNASRPSWMLLTASMGPPIYIGGNGYGSPNYRFTPAGASMGPPIYIGGNLYPFQGIQATNRCFNGATDLYRWKLSRTCSALGARYSMLQWGHRFISVETRRWRFLLPLRDQASMGPPIYIGGNREIDGQEDSHE